MFKKDNKTKKIPDFIKSVLSPNKTNSRSKISKEEKAFREGFKAGYNLAKDELKEIINLSAVPAEDYRKLFR